MNNADERGFAFVDVYPQPLQHFKFDMIARYEFPILGVGIGGGGIARPIRQAGLFL